MRSVSKADDVAAAQPRLAGGVGLAQQVQPNVGLGQHDDQRPAMAGVVGQAQLPADAGRRLHEDDVLGAGPGTPAWKPGQQAAGSAGPVWGRQEQQQVGQPQVLRDRGGGGLAAGLEVLTGVVVQAQDATDRSRPWRGWGAASAVAGRTGTDAGRLTSCPP